MDIVCIWQVTMAVFVQFCLKIMGYFFAFLNHQYLIQFLYSIYVSWFFHDTDLRIQQYTVASVEPAGLNTAVGLWKKEAWYSLGQNLVILIIVGCGRKLPYSCLCIQLSSSASLINSNEIPRIGNQLIGWAGSMYYVLHSFSGLWESQLIFIIKAVDSFSCSLFWSPKFQGVLWHPFLDTSLSMALIMIV